VAAFAPAMVGIYMLFIATPRIQADRSPIEELRRAKAIKEQMTTMWIAVAIFGVVMIGGAYFGSAYLFGRL